MLWLALASALVATGCDAGSDAAVESATDAQPDPGRRPSGDQTVGRFTKRVLLADDWRDGSAPVDQLAYPTEFEVAGDGSIFFTELGGALKRLDPADGRLETLLSLDVWSNVTQPTERTEEGLLGIALDPAFAANGYLYVYYGHGETLGAPGERRGRSRVSRFHYGGGAIDPGSEKILLEWSVDRDDCCHVGGGVESTSGRATIPAPRLARAMRASTIARSRSRPTPSGRPRTPTTSAARSCASIPSPTAAIRSRPETSSRKASPTRARRST
jgi:Glucose / Sorbosone dehydrogenase